jgi:D-alanyl-D-alanine carboxypeptidase
MRNTKRKKLVYGLIVAALLTIVVVLAWPAERLVNSGSSTIKTSNDTKRLIQPDNNFNKQQYSTDQASSLWVVVNKGRVLPGSYVPSDLVVPKMQLRYSAATPDMHVRADAAEALGQMFDAALQSGLNLMLTSGYRSYSSQVAVYGNYVKQSSVAEADTFSARPGHSEHQTGLAADLEPYDQKCELDQCFGDTPEGKWLAANCYKFGFVIRYPKDGQSLTGYVYEPWHVRYVGKGLADQLHRSGTTLEQFFGLPIYTSYASNSLTLKL